MGQIPSFDAFLAQTLLSDRASILSCLAVHGYPAAFWTGGFAQPARRAGGWENARAGAMRGTQRGWSTGIKN